MQDEDQIRVKEDPDDTTVDSERPRNQTTTAFIQNHGDITEQIANSGFIPLQIPQRQPAANEDLSPNEETIHVPVVQKKRKGGRRPSIKGRKAPKSESQLDQGKGKPSTKGRKNRQSKPEREPQAYVGRLRSGVESKSIKSIVRTSCPLNIFDQNLILGKNLLSLNSKVERRTRSEPIEIYNGVELRLSPNTATPCKLRAVV